MFVYEVVGLYGDGDFLVAEVLGLAEHRLDLFHLFFTFVRAQIVNFS